MQKKPRTSVSRAASRPKPARIARAVDALLSSEERFRNLLQDLHVAVILAGPGVNVQFANQAALDMFGLTEEEVLGKTPDQLNLTVLREDGWEYPFSMRPGPRAATTGQAVRNEVVGYRRKGSDEIIWAYGAVVPQFGSNGSVNRVTATFTDITERKKTEAALQEANELNQEILSSVQEGIIVHDRQLRYALWNPFMERISGMKKEDVLGRHPLDLFPFLAKVGVYAQIERALTGESVTIRNVPYTVPQTKQAGWCDNTFAPLRDAAGEIVGVVAAVRDITGRKRREDELRQLSSRLLAMQDEERRRIARDLHDSAGQHLFAVGLNLGKLSRSAESLDASGRGLLADTRRMVRSLSREIRSLSYLLHPPGLDELGLAAAIEEYANGFSQRSGIDVELDLSSEVGRLPQESETALFRIVQEALGNIQKHSGSSKSKIRLVRDSGHNVLEVTDAGRGMPARNLKKKLIAQSPLGVGILGMRERMRQLGGRIEIISGSWGTTVKAMLPLRGEVHDVSSHPRRG
jgi:PAS domain S-box-containing protein